MSVENEPVHASSLVASLQEINKFIKGGAFDELKQHLKAYDRHLIKFKRDFYLLTVFAGKDYPSGQQVVESGEEDDKYDSTAIIHELEILLTNLSIPKRRWGKYLNSQLTLHELLCQLNADLQIRFNIQLRSIIELIEERKNRNKKLYLIAGITSFILLTAAVASPFILGIIGLAKLVLASTFVFPAFGLLFTLAKASFYAYQNHFDKKSSLFNRLRDNSFLLLNTALNVSGNIVWLASATVIAPVAAVTLFLLSSVVDMAKEIFAAVQNRMLYKKPSSSEVLSLHEQQEQARHQIGYRQHRNAAIINTVAAVVLLAIMIAWQLVPGGIFVTLGAMAAIAIVYQVQKMVLKSNQNTMRDQLQNELRHIEQEHEKNNAGVLDNDNSLELDNSLEHEQTSGMYYDEAPVILDKMRGEESIASDSLELTEAQKSKSPSSFNYATATDVSFFKHLTKEPSAGPDKLASEELSTERAANKPH